MCRLRSGGWRKTWRRKASKAFRRRESHERPLLDLQAKRKKRGVAFDIALPLFSSLLDKACTYCGTHDRIGIDRVDSSLGYSAANCAPCCSDCNYAKREMSKESFLNLVARIYAHQSR